MPFSENSIAIHLLLKPTSADILVCDKYNVFSHFNSWISIVYKRQLDIRCYIALHNGK